MGPWDDGRRAWERLDGWDQDGAVPGHPDDGDGALAALSDIGTVRRLLDQAELAAVRTARRHGKSWAEIATRLGVTRQSAWERWRDLDEPALDPVDRLKPTAQIVELPGQVVELPGADYLLGDEEPDDLLDATAEELVLGTPRSRSSVVVPGVIGLSWTNAELRLRAVGLVAMGDDGVGTVTDQMPEAGARLPVGSPVRLWVDGGGGSGVREPRRPKPDPRSGRALPPEHSDPSA
jgi:transposase-like protein